MQLWKKKMNKPFQSKEASGQVYQIHKWLNGGLNQLEIGGAGGHQLINRGDVYLKPNSMRIIKW